MSNHPDRPEIDLVPLSLFSQRLAEGWKMVPGYPLQPDDYCVTMMPPRFEAPRSNRSLAGSNSAEKQSSSARWQANYRARKRAEIGA